MRARRTASRRPQEAQPTMIDVPMGGLQHALSYIYGPAGQEESQDGSTGAPSGQTGPDLLRRL
jgi:hypothetical protein